jgi:hypothetical protein
MRIYTDRCKKVTVTERKFDLQKLGHPVNSDQFRAGLLNSIAQIQKVQARSVKEKWQTIKTTMRNISERTLGYTAKERKEQISNIIQDKTDRRRLWKVQICGAQDLSEQGNRLLLE